MADEAIDSSRIEAAKEIALQEEGPRRRLEGPVTSLARGRPRRGHVTAVYLLGVGHRHQRRCCAWYFSCSPSFCLFSSIRQRAKVGSRAYPGSTGF